MNASESGHSVDLKGQVALVTGGGRGLGRAFAAALSAAGAAVAVVARTQPQLDETVGLITGQGGRAAAFPADVTVYPQMEQVVSAIENTLGAVDLLVNNAGLGATYGPVWDLPAAEWWRNMEVNLLGPLICARLALPGMLKRKRGRIINVASTSGLAPIANYSTYAVSKAALIRLSENMALEVKEQGVQVFAISVGTVRTALTEAALTDEGQKWIPWGKAFFDKGGPFDSPEKGAELVLQLASGRYDALSGLFLTIRDDLAGVAERMAEVRERKLYTLRLGRLG